MVATECGASRKWGAGSTPAASSYSCFIIVYDESLLKNNLTKRRQQPDLNSNRSSVC